jgi:activator of 2-hydroxyglutaryl-CoA dehydratase/benzoyl-CoA reductase/2-hydroxyglutaryl-CoA dehydratase subunit BcrC/BadD/HgdB
MDRQLFLGVDIGSTTLKAVLLSANGDLYHSLCRRTRPQTKAVTGCAGQCQQCGRCNFGGVGKILNDFLTDAGVARNDIARTIATGSQVIDDLLRFLHFDASISEVSAHIAAATHYYPDCRAVLDVGGQDSKAMLFDDEMKIWVSKMSGVCAAGTGAFLDGVADRLNVPVEKLAEHVNYDSPLQLSSVCAVLTATSINKFKNLYPLGDVVAAACRAQARTIVSGVGDLFLNYDGPIVFQGGVASNRAVAHYLQAITGNRILIPDLNQVMGALGAARIARDSWEPRRTKSPFDTGERRAPPDSSERVAPRIVASAKKSVAMRTHLTRQQFFSRSDAPLVWRNLFYPAEILNALGVRMLTMETYAALRARNGKALRTLFDKAARKGFAAETCSFLRVLEGDDALPKPDFVVGTSEPCQQGERVLADLVRDLGASDRYHLLYTPVRHDAGAIETIAAALEASVAHLERSLGIKMDMGRLKEACIHSNEARDLAVKCNHLRFTSPPLIRGSEAVLFATIFSQLWGKRELVELHRTLLEELSAAKESVEREIDIEDTHRLVWLHLPPFYSSRLMDFIELTCNAPVVFEEVNFVGWPQLDPDEPYRSLAQKLLTVGFFDPELRAAQLRKYAPVANVTGFLLYNHMFGRCSMADSCFTKRLRNELKAIGRPLLVLDGDCLDETIDPCSTTAKVRAFVESLNLKKFGNLFGEVRNDSRLYTPVPLRRAA